MVDFMVEKWANFATYYDPTPKDHTWPQYGKKNATYVRLDNSKIITGLLFNMFIGVCPATHLQGAN